MTEVLSTLNISFETAMHWLNNLSNFFLAIATVLLVVVTYYLKKATDLQYIASMTVAFQNEWHSRIASSMRDFLHSNNFKNLFNNAITEAFGKEIDYNKINKLLDRAELIGNDKDSERLSKFETPLRKYIYENPVKPGESLFTAYEAIYQVLLSFDRLALLRDEPKLMKKFIIKYKPPIRDLSTILQAFIAIRILLREDKMMKNYKKDYMFLLYKLKLQNDHLFKICKEGLKKRGEL